MKSLAERAAALSADRRALLQRRLAGKQMSSAASQRIPRRPGNGPARLSFGQERMWFIDRLRPGSPAYNVPAVLPLAEPLDVALLKRCLNEIARRHDVLRTTFHLEGKEVVQKVNPVADVAIDIVDAAHETEAGLTQLCNTEFARPFDLARGPLLRAVLVRLGPAHPPPQNRLLLTMHHIVSDAWSQQVLLTELRTLYAAYSAGLPSPLPELPIQYADFAEWQRNWLQGETRDRLLSYWKRHLDRAPALLNLPTDKPRPAISSFRGAMQTTRLPAQTVAELKTIGNGQRCTLFMTMLSLFALLLQRYAAEDDLVIGTPIANRGRSEIEPLIGFFLNTLTLRIDTSGDPTFTEFLQRLREVTLGGFAHQDFPFEALVQELQPKRHLNANPLFQVMFVLQSPQDDSANGANDLAESNGAASERNSDGSECISRFDLTLAWTERAGVLEGLFEYSTDLFEPATIKRMAEDLRELAKAVVEQPDLRLSQLPRLTKARREIAREASPRPEPEQPSRKASLAPADDSAPADQGVQGVLAGIWADVLGVERVNPDDNFFDIGGHSLMAVQIISRVHDTFDVDLAVQVIFEAATIRLLSKVIEERLEAQGGVARSEPETAGVSSAAATAVPSVAQPDATTPTESTRTEGAPTSSYPLSYAQERLWFIEQVQPGNVTYNIPFRLPVAEPVNVVALERALNEVVRRHESLRTTFAAYEGGAVQIVGPAVPFSLPIIDLRSVPMDYRGQVVADVAAKEGTRPFDLTRGPLMRATLLRWDTNWSELLLTIHHIVTDGWSWSVMSRELTALYEAFRAGQSSPLPEPVLQYRDYVNWQRAHLQGTTLEELLSYWRRQLSVAPTLQLPFDHPRPARPSDAGAYRQFAVAGNLIERFRQISQRCGATMFVVLLAAFKVLLWRYCQQTDIVVGTAVANRNHSQHEGLIGLLVNSLALRSDLSGDPSFLSVVDRVRQVTLTALAHEDLPFERIVAELAPERTIGANPIFQVFFAHYGGPKDPASHSGEPPKQHQASTAKFDFSLHLMETAGDMVGIVEYSVTLFDAATVDRMIEDFRKLLGAIAADAGQPISALASFAPLNEAMRRNLNGERAPAPPSVAAVRLTPERAAAAPALPVEKVVAEIWTEVLGSEQFSATDDFFQIGGHSLQVIRVLSRLRDVLNVDLSVAEFFGAPTVVGLAALITQERDPEALAAQPATPAGDGNDAVGAEILPLKELPVASGEGISP